MPAIDNVRLQKAEAQSKLMDRGTHVEQPSTIDFFRASVDEVLDLDTLNSRARTEALYFEGQRSDLQQMIDEGDIPEEIAEAHRFGRNRNMDWRKLAKWSNENLGTEFDKDTATYKAWMQQRAKEREELFSYADGWGYMAMLGGGLTASAADPGVWATAVFSAPYSTAKVGSSTLGIVGRRILQQAGVNMAAEVPIQLMAFENRRQLEIDYGFTDMGFNIAIAAALGAPFGLVNSLGDVARIADVRDLMNSNASTARWLEVEGPPQEGELPAIFNSMEINDINTLVDYLGTIDGNTPLVEAERMIKEAEVSIQTGELFHTIRQESREFYERVDAENEKIEATMRDGEVLSVEQVEGGKTRIRVRAQMGEEVNLDVDDIIPDYDPKAPTVVEGLDGPEVGTLEDRLKQIDTEFEAESAQIENARVCANG